MGSLIEYVRRTFCNHTNEMEEDLKRVPLQLEVANSLLGQVVRILDAHPRAAALTEATADAFELEQPHRPEAATTPPRGSDGPSR